MSSTFLDFTDAPHRRGHDVHSSSRGASTHGGRARCHPVVVASLPGDLASSLRGQLAFATGATTSTQGSSSPSARSVWC